MIHNIREGVSFKLREMQDGQMWKEFTHLAQILFLNLRELN